MVKYVRRTDATVSRVPLANKNTLTIILHHIALPKAWMSQHICITAKQDEREKLKIDEHVLIIADDDLMITDLL